MKVLFDYQIFDKQTHGGISRSFVSLFSSMPSDVSPIIGVRETANVYLKEMGVRPQGYKRTHFLTSRDFPGKDLAFRAYNKLFNVGYGNDYNQKYSERLLRDGDYDVFHPTFFSPYFLPLLKGKPFVLTVHDMTPEVNPDHFPKETLEVTNKRLLLPHAAAIVAVSEYTKRDLLKIYPEIPEDKVTVVYHGPSFPTEMQPRDTYANGKYILFVGHRWKYKNFGLFVKHVSPFLHRHKDIKVICTGEQFYPFEHELMGQYGVDSRFQSVFVKSDQDFMDLYHGALAFVFPSSAEGFGMPILEAFQSRTVCLLNHASCLPEVGGDAASYFHISDAASDLSEALELAYGMTDAQRQDVLQRQLDRLADFSWEKSAHALAKVYKSVI